MLSLVVGPMVWVYVVLSAAVFAVALFAAVDAVIRPERAYAVVGRKSKTFWVGILLAAVAVTAFMPVLAGGLTGMLTLAALVAALVYLVDMRPKLRQLRRGRGSVGPYGPW